MKNSKVLILTILMLALVLSACGASEEGQPTLTVEQIQTLAVMTYQAQLTQTALAMPTATSTPLPTTTPIIVVTFASTDGSSAAVATNTQIGGAQPGSCYALSFVKDVTIPDNTAMTPGQSFTKTWLVSNTGTCDWEPGFIFNVVGGDGMSGVAVTLTQAVQPGRQFEFSVPMVAPTNKTGEIKGTWRLADSNNTFFGDGVYVVIEVGGSGTAVPTDTPTPTP